MNLLRAEKPAPVILALSLAYIALLVYGFSGYSGEIPAWILVLPPLIVFAGVAWFNFTLFQRAMVFLIPLSINLTDVGDGFGVSLPVEPMVFLVGIVFLFKWLHTPWLGMRELLHPISVMIYIHLFWIGVTSCTSSSQEASLKLLVSRAGYLMVFYCLQTGLFRDLAEIRRFLWLYLLGFVPVILYSLYAIGSHGFARSYSPAMSAPFYSDHTIFGATLAMLLPVFWIFWMRGRSLVQDLRLRRALWFLVPLLIFAILFSFSRAAWLSIIGALFFAGILALRVRFTLILGMAVALTIGAVTWGEDILENLKKNEARDHVENEFLEHAATIADVDRDESNKERINRWSCALRMFHQRPWLGWGPGTYEFNYGPFQVSSEITRISTFDGDRGDAHSEYMTALSEQGLAGFIIIIALFVTLLITGMTTVYQATDPVVRRLATGITLGFVTYFIHGAVNSFLDIDKTASLFWAMAGMLVALDVYHNRGLIPKNL